MTHLIVLDFCGEPLALTREQLESAREAGRSLIGQPAPSGAAERVELVDAETAAAQLGISRRWIEDATRQGIIPVHRLGRFLRYDVRAIAAHSAASGAPIPKSDAASNGLANLWPKSGLTNHGVARGVSRMSPRLHSRVAPALQPSSPAGSRDTKAGRPGAEDTP